MSTNYYWNSHGSTLTKGTPYEVNLHIGKSAGGWSFMFQAHEVKVYKAQPYVVTDGITIKLPDSLEISIRSWSDWKNFLKKNGGVIQDEYGTKLTFAEFVEMVETHLHPKGAWGKDAHPLKNHYDEGLSGQWSSTFQDSSKYWKDEEGYSFSLPAFS